MTSTNRVEPWLQKIPILKSNMGKYGFYEICTKILTFICIVLIICLLIIAILLWLEKRETYCETDKCIRSATLLKLSMNLTADPCRDFFKFSCGRWSKEHPLTPRFSKYSRFTHTNVGINLAVQEFLSAKDENHDVLPVRQSRMFYRSCLDKKAREVLGFTTIFEYLQKIDLPIIPSLFLNESVANDTFDWMRTEAKLKKIFKIDALFSLNVYRNRYNSSENIMYIGRPLINCDSRNIDIEVGRESAVVALFLVTKSY